MIMVKRKNIILILIFLIGSLLAFYTINYTSREKHYLVEYKAREKIHCFDISYTGSLIAVGGANGSISLMRGDGFVASWNFKANKAIDEIKMTASGDYFGASDIENNIYLFSKVPKTLDNEAVPLWKEEFTASSIQGVYSSEGMPSLVYVLVSCDDGLKLLNRDGTSVCNYFRGVKGISARISFDGSWIIASNSCGEIYLFHSGSEELLWSFSSNLKNISLAFSLDSNFIAIGGEKTNGSGALFILSRSSGKLVFNKNFEDPVKDVSISASGSRYFVSQGNNILTIFQINIDKLSEKQINFEDSLKSYTASPYGLYVVGVTSSKIEFFHLSRPSPLWYFISESTPRSSLSSQNSNYIYVNTDHSIYLLKNNEFSEIIPGSRRLWGLFLTSITILSIYYLFYTNILSIIKNIKKIDVYIIISFSIVIVLINTLIKNDTKNILIIFGGYFIGYLLYLKDRRLTSLLLASYIGLMASAVIGIYTGFYYWVMGSEDNIIQILFLWTGRGLRLGLVSGPLGSTVGLIRVSANSK